MRDGDFNDKSLIHDRSRSATDVRTRGLTVDNDQKERKILFCVFNVILTLLC